MTNTNLPLISVLMTVYNREKYVAEAIESVIASTYQNWELIIVDDRSKDTSVEIAKGYESKDKRISVYVNEQNLGDYPNRNQAASYAKGKYLKYVDADDMIYPYGLEQLVYYMEQFPDAGYGLCSLSQDKEKVYPFKLSPKEAYVRHFIEHKGIFSKAPLSSVIKTTAFNEIGGFTGKQHVGDFEMWLRMSQVYNVVLMPQGIAWYREHDDQQMNDNREDPFVPFKYLLIAEGLIQSAKCPLEAKQVEKSLKKLQQKKAKSVVSAIRRHSIKKGMELRKKGNVPFVDILKR